MLKTLLLIFASSSTAFALDLTQLQGSSRQQFTSPNGLREYCVTPRHWPGGGYYRSNDKEKENTLCGYDFYSNVGICPKYNSTNPGVLLLKPNNKYSKSSIDSSSCNVKAMDLSTEAKFKQSISCSNTSAILAYYQLSRQLGYVGRVPVAVIRTMDRNVHSQLTQKANIALRSSRDLIAQTWDLFRKAHRNPEDYPLIFDSTRSQVYGALSDNPKNEEKYTEVSGTGSYANRYQSFLLQGPFQRVASSRSVRELVGSSDFIKIAQTVTQMKDVGDMVLIDTLLNQQDRIGNIHYKFFWYSVNPQTPGQIDRAKSDTKWKNGRLIIPSEESAAMKNRKSVLVKEMLLKDNDCGVNKDNMMRKVSALEKVRHLSYLTYAQFMKFQKSLSDSSIRDYFTTELLFTRTDYASLQDNAAKARDILKSRCRAGQLRFDVDLSDYIPGAPLHSTSCEI
jgi:hypothetical protein